MNRSIEQSLTSLIPSLSGPLPQELVQLATSLLAQSRSKASTLKPDEEIARTHACAHLACERLKQSLNLPQIVSRPPCPPRIYQKLYAFFNQSLPPRPLRSVTQLPVDTSGSSVLTSPSKSRSPVKNSTTTPGKSIRGRHVPSLENGELPEWVMPIIRRICRGLDSPAAIPHVYAGVCSVLRLQQSQQGVSNATGRGRSRKHMSDSIKPMELLSIDEQDLPALISVILFYTMARLLGTITTTEQYMNRRAKAIHIIISLKMDSSHTEEELRDNIERLMRDAQNGWLQLEWYLNIDEGSGISGLKEPPEDETGANSAQISPGEVDMPQHGLGTMMQDKIDYLSDNNRLDYVEWKEAILARIERMENEKTSNTGSTEMITSQ